MDFDVGRAVGAFFLATGVMAAMIYIALGMLPKQTPTNMLYMLGTMTPRD